MNISDRMEKMQSGTRGPVYKAALKLSESGEKVLKLNTGNPAAFGFKMPESLKRAVAAATEKAAAYSESSGIREAKDAILAYYTEKKNVRNIDEEDIFLGNGVSELAEMVSTALLGPEDEVLLPSPNYNLWSNSAIMADAKPVFYECFEDNAWMPKASDIESHVTEHTRAIVIINPNNPTGALYSDELLLEIAEIARKHDLVILADEIYDRLVMDGKEHHSIAALAPDLPIITFNGLSKSHIICGLRCGWMVLSGCFGEAEGAYKSPLHKALDTIASIRLCSNTMAQFCVKPALEDSEYTEAMLVPGGRIYDQREACMKAIEESECLKVVKNTGALYCFVQVRPEKCRITDPVKFSVDLLNEKKIYVVTANGFDYPKANYFRVVMLPEPEELSRAIREIDDFCKHYSQE